ncbi:MBL fold metallo-hydrolase [Prosthecomicrobium sp. N25]|uniref:MBL fold metallo-hydrolase n=1 Tax=Prosthecomicrobium sp. N25 TaxID=3129254 RepID=UPI0030771EE1
MPLDVNAFALRLSGGITLVDAGGGPALGTGFGRIRPALAGMGIRPEDVEAVCLTHLHSDHAGGLFDEDRACFPRATVMVPAAELAFFTDPAARERTHPDRRSGFRMAAALTSAYDGRIRALPEGPVVPGLDCVALPGHTPGHAGYRLGEGAGALLLWGDVVHLPELQVADPDLGLVYDFDPALAAETRRSLLARCAGEQWIVAGGHTGFGRVTSGGDGFAFEPLP